MFAENAGDGLAARACALSILEQVLGQKKMLDSVLDKDAAFAALPARDRAFARMLVATVLRRKGQMDDLVARALNKGEEPRPERLRWILYLGIAQILFMDVADHAAVDTSVTLTAGSHMEGKKGFVNAILRRMAGEGKAWLEKQDIAALALPAWLHAQWMHDYGIVRTKDMVLASLEEAPLDISLKDSAAKDGWAKKLEAEVLPTGSLRRASGGHVSSLAGFDDGAWWVQDASSALPARLFGDLSGKTVLDLCAAPGGKTMQLAAQGAKVVALDRSAARMAMLSDNLRRVGLAAQVQTIIEDGAVWRPKEKFSHILLDAPCTATGTIRRHPDLLHLKTEKDQTGLMSIQERLLANAAAMLAPGGTLVYCTCSLQKDEGERQIDSILASGAGLQRKPIRREEIGNVEGLVNGDGDIRVLPYHLKELGGMDGFFVARLYRPA